MWVCIYSSFLIVIYNNTKHMPLHVTKTPPTETTHWRQIPFPANQKKRAKTLWLILTHSNTVHSPSMPQSHISLSFPFPQSMASSQTRALRRRRTEASKPISHSPLKPYPKPQIDDCYRDTACQQCGSGDAADKLLLCDKCDNGFHLFCLRPIMVSVPKGRWFCHSCSRQKKLKRT